MTEISSFPPRGILPIPTSLASLCTFNVSENKARLTSLVTASPTLQLRPNIIQKTIWITAVRSGGMVNMYLCNTSWVYAADFSHEPNIIFIPDCETTGLLSWVPNFFVMVFKGLRLNCTFSLKFLSYVVDLYTYKRKSGTQGKTWPSTSVSKGRNNCRQPTRVPARLQLKFPVIFSSSCKKIRA